MFFPSNPRVQTRLARACYAGTHNVTMQIADGPRQKCLLARFAVGAAPEAADFNYESSATDRRARASERASVSLGLAGSSFEIR